MYKVKCEIEGIAPLLHDNPWNIKDQLMGKVKSQSACSAYNEKQLYKNESGECCIPATHIKGAMKWAAKKVKFARGTITQFVKACVYIDETMITLGKKHADEINENIYPDKKGMQHYKERPMFYKGWKVSFTITVFEDSLPSEKIEECLNIAGMLFGIGCRRPDYGRFIIKKFETIKAKKAA